MKKRMLSTISLVLLALPAAAEQIPEQVPEQTKERVLEARPSTASADFPPILSVMGRPCLAMQQVVGGVAASEEVSTIYNECRGVVIDDGVGSPEPPLRRLIQWLHQ